MPKSVGRHSASGSHVIKAMSSLDHRVRLHIDFEEEDYYIEFHEESDPSVIQDLEIVALSHGLCQEDYDEVDEYEMEQHIGYGYWRRYLVKSIHDDDMPSLNPTGLGPMSGFMEAV